MSGYLGSRRRFSEPEKPQARFQWRMRVNSLMMDDSEHAPSLVARRLQRNDTRNPSRDSTSRAVYETEDRDFESSVKNESSGALSRAEERRERFTRTKSEGHLKLRVRFSRVPDEGASSLDEPEETKRSSFRYRRYSCSTEQPVETEEAAEAVTSSNNRFHAQGDPEYDHENGGRYKEMRESRHSRSEDSASGTASGNFGEGAIPKRFGDYKSWKMSKSDSDGGEEKLASAPLPPATPSERSPLTHSSLAVTECEDNELPSNTVKEEENQSTNQPNVLVDNRDMKRSGNFECLANETVKIGQSLSQHEEIKDRRHGDEENHLKSPERTFENIAGSQSLEKEEEDQSLLEKDALPTRDQMKISPIPSTEAACLEVEESQEANSKHVDTPLQEPTAAASACVENIIEEMIDEEENTSTNDKECGTALLRASLANMTPEDLAKFKKEMDDIQKTIDEYDGEYYDESQDDVFAANRAKRPMIKRPSESIIESNPVIYRSSSVFPCCKKSAADDESEEEQEEDAGGSDTWADLPVILLEDVYCLLTPKQRHQASQVCRQWYDLFYSPRVWETFILLERTLTKKRFNLYKGYQRELCPAKTQICFRRVGSFFKRIVVTPIKDYFNLYEFLRILASFLQFQEEHGEQAMPLLHTFDFTFACASRDEGGVIVHGTGGQILEMIKELLVRMHQLKHLKLNQLLLDVLEVKGLFDAVVNCFGESLNSLELLNVTKIPFPLTDVAQFRNLIKLSLSPQHLNEEVIILLAGLSIFQLHLVQDKYTCPCEPVPSEAWKLVHEMAPWMRVYLEVIGITRAELLIQPRAPVQGVFLRTPYSRLTGDLAMSLVENYSKTLRYYVQECLPRVHGPRGFEARCDSNLLFLIRRCSALHTLVVNERMSTSTLILLATEGKSLSTLIVRQHALLKRCDWPRRGEWSHEFYARLREASLDYQKCTDRVCSLLCRRWKPVADKQFMRLKIVPNINRY